MLRHTKFSTIFIIFLTIFSEQSAFAGIKSKTYTTTNLFQNHNNGTSSILNSPNLFDVYLPLFDKNLGNLRKAEFSVKTNYIYNAHWDASLITDGVTFIQQNVFIDLGQSEYLTSGPPNDDYIISFDIGITSYNNANSLPNGLSIYPGDVGSYSINYTDYSANIWNFSEINLLSLLTKAGKFKFSGSQRGESGFEVFSSSGSPTGYVNSDVLSTYFVKYTYAVPEPQNWMMMLVGFGLIGAALRRRTVEFSRSPQYT